METQRLVVRLDAERHHRLHTLAAAAGLPVSALVRRLIDEAYAPVDHDRRMRATMELGQMQVEDLPDPDGLSWQLERTCEPGGLDEQKPVL